MGNGEATAAIKNGVAAAAAAAKSPSPAWLTWLTAGGVVAAALAQSCGAGFASRYAALPAKVEVLEKKAEATESKLDKIGNDVAWIRGKIDSGME